MIQKNESIIKVENESNPSLVNVNNFDPVQILYAEAMNDAKINVGFVSKLCVDLDPIKNAFKERFEHIYSPIIGLLPDSYQAALLDQAWIAGLDTLTCLFIISLILSSFIIMVLISKREYKTKLVKSLKINQRLISLENELRKTKQERDLFAGEIGDFESKLSEIERERDESRDKITEITDQNKLALQNARKEVEKLETEMEKRTKSFNAQINEIIEKLKSEESDKQKAKEEHERSSTEFESRINELNQALSESRSSLEQYYVYSTNLNAELQLVKESEAQLRVALSQTEYQKGNQSEYDHNSHLQARVTELEKHCMELEVNLAKERSNPQGKDREEIYIKEKSEFETKLRSAERTMKVNYSNRSFSFIFNLKLR